MITRKVFTVSLFFFFALSLNAQIYTGLAGSLSMHPEGEREGVQLHPRENYTSGYGGKFVVGYTISQRWDVNISAENIWLAPSPVTDDHQLSSITANVKYYLFDKTSSKPYVGIGGGFFRSSLEDKLIYQNDEILDLSETIETFSGFPTIGYMINPEFSERLHFNAELSYRFPFTNPSMKHFLFNTGVYYYWN